MTELRPVTMHQCPSCGDRGDDVWLACHVSFSILDAIVFAPLRSVLRFLGRHGVIKIEHYP